MKSESLKERIRIAAEGVKMGTRKVWHPPTLDDLGYGTTLNFDQTITKTGWSLLRRGTGDVLHVEDGGVLEPWSPEGSRSFTQTLHRSLSLKIMMAEVIEAYGPVADAIVHEMPSVRGYRLESSLLGADGVWSVAHDFGHFDKVVMISKQRAYANLVHVYPSEKKHVTEAVNALIPNYNRATKRWTQDVHDSVLLGLQWLHERKSA